jgi:hypothetical protein
MVPLLSIGAGKSATAHIIQSAAAAYKDRGFRYVFLADDEDYGKLTGCRFYYADERKVDGSAAYFDIDGEAHGSLCAAC